MKSKRQFTPYFRRFCTISPEYVKLKVELGVGLHRSLTNRPAVPIMEMLRAKATCSFSNVAITKLITNSFALNRRAKP